MIEQLEKIAQSMMGAELKALAGAICYNNFVEQLAECEDARLIHKSKEQLHAQAKEALVSCECDLTKAKIAMVISLVDESKFSPKAIVDCVLCDDADVTATAFACGEDFEFVAPTHQRYGTDKLSVKRAYAEVLGIELGLLTRDEVVANRMSDANERLGAIYATLNDTQKEAVEFAMATLAPAAFVVAAK